MTKADRKKLRNKLPQRGYTELVQKHAGKGISIDNIKCFYSGKPVSEDKVRKIVAASVKVIAEEKEKADSLKRMAEAA